MITKRKLRQSIMFILKKNEAELGFTLIEVLVSTLIVGMILSSIFYTIGFLNINLDRITVNHKNYESFIRTLSVIEQDLKTISSRTIRDEYGDYQPSLIVNNQSDKKIIFSRSIFDEKDLIQHTYRIEYDFSNQILKRNVWNVLDRIQNSNYQTQFFDKNITDISISVTDNGMQWYKFWPIGYIQTSENIDASSIGLTTRNDIEAYQNLTSGKFKTDKLPNAFKILINHKYFGEIERVFLSQI